MRDLTAVLSGGAEGLSSSELVGGIKRANGRLRAARRVPNKRYENEGVGRGEVMRAEEAK